MEPTGKIAPQDWMTRRSTRAVLEALGAGGAPARFVGGCVRDAVAGRPVEDVDIATPEPPDRVTALLEEAGLKAVPTGLKHGTVTAVSGGIPFQITTLRIDVETDGRHARVAFTDDWIADAARRDFTINTLSATPEGDVYDPFGGLEDLARGRVRFVGVARRRIEEDLLRLLRFFRFYAAFGQPPPNGEALAACREMAPRLAELSAERVREELFRILLGPDPAETIGLMRGERILDSILPEAGNTGRLRMVAWLETRGLKRASVEPDPVRRLAAVLDAGAEPSAVAARLRLSNRQAARLAGMAASSFGVAPDMGGAARRRALYRIGAEAVRDLTLLTWAAERAVQPRPAEKRTEAWMALLADLDASPPVELPIRGGDVTALGVPAGREVGKLLAGVEAWWEDDGCRADRAACLARLEAAVEGR